MIKVKVIKMEASRSTRTQRGQQAWLKAVDAGGEAWSLAGIWVSSISLSTDAASRAEILTRHRSLVDRDETPMWRGVTVTAEDDDLEDSPLALLITVRRPQVRNALDLSAISALAEIAETLGRSPDQPAAVILTGADGTFVAGGDLKSLSEDQRDEKSESLAAKMSKRMSDALETLRALPCPFLVAAEGHAVGGGAELLIAADLRVVSAELRVRFAQVSLGLCTGWGGARRLVSLLGRQRALSLLLGGDLLDAKRCLELGIAHRVASAGEALNAALKWAADLALVPVAVREVKALFQELDQEASLAHVSQGELSVFPQLWRGDEHWDAVERFWARHHAAQKLPNKQGLGHREMSPQDDDQAAHDRGGQHMKGQQMKGDQMHRDQYDETQRAELGEVSERGLFIVLEGIDGAGTTTQAHQLIEQLQQRGREAHFTCEPSEGVIGTLTRSALRGEPLGRGGALLPPESLALLFAADRADHWHNEIEPLLRAGVDVICDRYLYSSLAYQGMELDERWVRSLNQRFPAPDLLLFVEVSPEVAASRRDQRQLEPDRYEVDELQRVIASRYARLCREAEAVIVDGDQGLNEVSVACERALEHALNGSRSHHSQEKSDHE